MVRVNKMNTLSWSDLWNKLGMTRDNGGRFYPSDSTPECIKDYLSQYRAPSRAWPHSYAKPLMTKKFSKWLAENHTDLAIKYGIIEVSQ